MARKRYDLPPLGFVQGFEAAARTLSFTRAADELALTQSAVSRQIKTLEEHLGVTLFERRHRALALTEDGRAFQRIAIDVLDRLQGAINQMRARSTDNQLAVTTVSGFASLWLIPRLKRFTRLHPHIDVRIIANDRVLDLDRSMIDLAIRYSKTDRAAPGAERLFAEDILPVCHPSLVADSVTPLRRPEDLRHHTLLHLDYHGASRTWFDWGTWMTALGIEDLKPAGSLRFSRYDQMIQAAMSGQGVALGVSPLINEAIRSGTLVAPFDRQVDGPHGYYLIRSMAGAAKPQVAAFCAWLREEAAEDAIAEPLAETAGFGMTVL
ncbi:MAG: transcriptional regulator GcvA [Phreatobacter sp.]|nr:transcriptional regulator GcvA [Phreatobacter sp.]